MKKIDNPVYVCEVCGTRYKTEEEAVKCENECSERKRKNEARAARYKRIMEDIDAYNKDYPNRRINTYESHCVGDCYIDGDGHNDDFMKAVHDIIGELI